MSDDVSKATEKVLKQRMEAVKKSDIDGILSYYTEESVLFTPEGPVHGLVEIRAFFDSFFDALETDFAEDLIMLCEDVEGEIGYTLWAAEPYVSMGTDTFIIRDGKVVVHTFAAG